MILQRIGSLLFVLAGLALFIAAAGSKVGIDHTVENSRKLDQQFRSATHAIAGFEKLHSRLPTEDEFHTLLPQRVSHKYDLTLAPASVKDCDRAGNLYSQLPARDYVLATWRGEWFECSAPTKGWSTLRLNPSDYSVTGSVLLDSAIFALAAIGCFILAIWLWKYHRRKGHKGLLAKE